MLDKMMDIVIMTVTGAAGILVVFALIVLLNTMLRATPELSCHEPVECISFQGEVWCKKIQVLQQVGD